jgi:hypothetical protein
VTTQKLCVDHARQNDVVSKLRLAGALRASINLAKRFADYIEFPRRQFGVDFAS